jgi:hypothetical protein
MNINEQPELTFTKYAVTKNGARRLYLRYGGCYHAWTPKAEDATRFLTATDAALCSVRLGETDSHVGTIAADGTFHAI